jgi:heterotetrameric sarcosine oxidase delta subunit
MGWHTEWWHHSGGCRQWVKVVRNTLTHEIAATGAAGDKLEVPSR